MFKEIPLHLAASNGHFSVVEYLVKHEAHINAKRKDDDIEELIGLPYN